MNLVAAHEARLEDEVESARPPAPGTRGCRDGHGRGAPARRCASCVSTLLVDSPRALKNTLNMRLISYLINRYLRHQRPPTPPHTRKEKAEGDRVRYNRFRDFQVEVRKTALWKALCIDRCCCRCCCRHLVDISRHAASPYERLLEQIARHILPSQLWHDSVSSEATLSSVGAWPSHVSASVGIGSRLCFRLTTLVRAPVRRCRMLSSTLGRGGSTPAAANQP